MFISTLSDDYLYNKEVILVCPGGYLIGGNKGEEIDSYERVVRVNYFDKTIIDNNKKDIGEKTNILYFQMNLKKFRDFSNEDLVFFQNQGLEYLISREDLCQPHLKLFMENHSEIEIPIVLIEKIIFERLANNNIKKSILTGILAIEHLLSFPIKKLFIIGMDFYYSQYLPSYISKESGVKAKSNFNKSFKKYKTQIEYFKKIVKENDRIILDDYLIEVLNKI